MYLGIDLGTSAMKCLIIGEEQEIIISVSSKDIPLSTPNIGWSGTRPIFLDYCFRRVHSPIKREH